MSTRVLTLLLLIFIALNTSTNCFEQFVEKYYAVILKLDEPVNYPRVAVDRDGNKVVAATIGERGFITFMNKYGELVSAKRMIVRINNTLVSINVSSLITMGNRVVVAGNYLSSSSRGFFVVELVDNRIHRSVFVEEFVVKSTVASYGEIVLGGEDWFARISESNIVFNKLLVGDSVVQVMGIDANGNDVVIAGCVERYRDTDGFVARLSGDRVVWFTILGGRGEDCFTSVSIDENYVYAIGYTSSFGQGLIDIVVSKLFRENGSIVPITLADIVLKHFIVIGSTENIHTNEFCLDTVVDRDKALILTGSIQDPDTLVEDGFIGRLVDETIVWFKAIGERNASDVFTSIALDSLNNIVVVGVTNSYGSTRDIIVVKTNVNGIIPNIATGDSFEIRERRIGVTSTILARVNEVQVNASVKPCTYRVVQGEVLFEEIGVVAVTLAYGEESIDISEHRRVEEPATVAEESVGIEQGYNALLITILVILIVFFTILILLYRRL